MNYRNFEEARKYAHSLNLKSRAGWEAMCKAGSLPPDIPHYPNQVYINDGWISQGDFLGNGNIATSLIEYLKYPDAEKYVHKLKLQTKADWDKLKITNKIPSNIPHNPNQTYKNKGWVSWGVFLGTNYVHPRFRRYRSFEDARKYARSLKFKSITEWREHCRSGKVPLDIRTQPNLYDEFISTADFLGSTNVRGNWREFSKARKFARSLKLQSFNEWREFAKTSKKPIDIPANPISAYKGKGWISAGDWIGTGVVAHRLKKYRSFKEARKYARSLNLKSRAGWRALSKAGKLPDDIPYSAHITYKDQGWVSMGDWLGTGIVAPRLRKYRSFKEARKYARSLNLKSFAEWRALSKAGKLPDDIPGYPNQTYKDQGWISVGDWLGY